MPSQSRVMRPPLFFVIFVLLSGLTQAQSPTGAIVGRVQSTDGKPAANVRVAATPASDENNPQGSPGTLVSIVETDSEGRYRLENVPAGRYHVMAGLLDSATYYPAATTPATAGVVQVTAGRTTDGVDFALLRSAGVSVRGRVVRADGNTAILQRLFLNPTSSPSNPRLDVTVAPDGSFEVLRVPPGNYGINLSPGFPGQQAAQIAVDDADISGLELYVPLVRQTSGRIVVAGDSPQPRLSLFFTSGEATVTSSTGRDGSFGVSLPEGDYRIVVSGFPAGYRVESITRGSADLLTAPLHVSGSDVSGILVTLAAPPQEMWLKVRGRVESPPGPGPAPASVLLDGSQVLQGLEARIDADGSFEFPKVLPGTYTIRVQSLSIPTSVTLNVNRNLDAVEIVLPRQIEAVGRVMVEGDGPLPRLNVSATGKDGRSVQAFTETDGGFSMILPEGEYRLGLPNLPSGYSLKSVSDGATQLVANVLRVSGADKPDIRLNLAAPSPSVWKRVSGKVTRQPDSTESQTMKVSLNGSGFTLEASVSSDGSFVLPKVLPGTYVAFLQGARFVKPINVTLSDKDVTDLEFVTRRSVQVEGRIVREENGPLPHLQFRVTNEFGTFAYSESANGTFTLTLPEGESRVTIGEPPEGYVVKSFTAGSVNLLEEPLQLSATNSPQLLLTLAPDAAAPWRKLTGRVLPLPGTSLPGRLTVALATASHSAESAVGPDGSFAFPRLLPGTYTVRLRTGSGSPLTAPPPDIVLADKVIVGDRDVTDLDLRMPRRIDVTVRVTVEDGGPLPRASLLVDDVALDLGMVRPDGSFAVGLPEGDHRLSMTFRSGPWRVRSMSYGSADLLRQAARIDAANPQTLLITLDTGVSNPWRKVTGRIPQPPGAMPVAGSVVLGGFGIQTLETAVKADGSFEFARVPPGNYSAYLQPVMMYSPSAEVVVGDTDVSGVALMPPQVVEIPARVAVDEGDPPPPQSIVMRAETARPIHGLMGMMESVASDEGMALQLVQGEYRVTTVRLPAGFYVRSMTRGSADLLNGTLRADGAAEMPIEITLVRRDPASIVGPRISGRIVLPDSGAPRPGTVAFSATEAGGETFEAPIKPDNSFEYAAIPAGAYDARLIGDKIPAAIQQYRTRVVVEDKDRSDVELKAVLWARVTGRIVIDGAPPPGFEQANTSVQFRQGAFAIGENIRADGSFEMALVKGDYQLSLVNLPKPYFVRSISSGGTNLAEGRFTNAADGPLEFIITLGTQAAR